VGTNYHTQPDAAGVRVELGADRVAVVELRRPPENFFDAQLLVELATACEELRKTTCRAVVLCSEGKHFCAGAKVGAPPPGDEHGPHPYEIALGLFEQPLPIVAAIQGAAIGGGLGLALVADFRIASPEARFSANFARLGFHHGFGLSVTLPSVIGRQASLDLLYTGRRIDAAQALAIGLCDAVVPADELRDAARRWALEIARSAPLAVQSIRETMRTGLVEQVRGALARERSEQERLMGTADCREGILAMSERREPEFHGG
jgi:enoyl-CoA hydratase/carnithine racemase